VQATKSASGWQAGGEPICWCGFYRLFTKPPRPCAVYLEDRRQKTGIRIQNTDLPAGEQESEYRIQKTEEMTVIIKVKGDLK
jgi:hypothetical protein